MARAAVQSNILAAQQKKLNPELELPVGEAPVTAPAPVEAPPNSGWLEALVAQQQPEAAPEIEGLDQGVQEAQAIEQEVERQAIPSLRERGQDINRVDRWLKPVTSSVSQQPDGGLRGRASNMAKNMENNGILPVLTATVGPESRAASKAGVEGTDLANVIATEKEGNLMAAVSRANAVVTNSQGHQVPAPEYVQVASAVVENDLANGFFGGESDLDFNPEERTEPTTVPVHQGNGALGNKIHQEFQRMQGVKVPEKLPAKEAEVLGATFKDMWALNNPKYVTRTPNPVTGLHEYQLTSAGDHALRLGTEDRKRLFPKVNVRPAKSPLPTGQLPGDVGQNVVRKVAGHSVGKPKFGKAIEEAMVNLAKVPNVVDKQRAKILYSTILPVLAAGDYNNWMAEINNIGPSKIQKYAAEAAEKVRKGEISPVEEAQYADGILNALTDKIAQEVRAIAQERNGANYLSYSVQGFQGRIQPQQSFFNPTTSKAVRFVTRNAVPAMAKPGSRVEKNLRQMYAMMLVKGADAALPAERERMLTTNSAKLEAWGDQLANALTMTDEQYEGISQAISEGKPLNDPAFEGLAPMEIQDPELQAAVEAKGEDGPHFIDGLIDFAKYQKAKRAGRAHPSFFNAYIDGKTNGLASNGIQMGHTSTAQATGVVRDNRTKLLDAGDIRDQLKDIAVESIEQGWDGNTDGYESELNDVAATVFSHRDLNKAVTMTFGYGKEIRSFIPDIESAIGLLSEQAKTNPDSTFNESLSVIDGNMTRTELAEMLLNQKYEPAVRSVMSDEAMEARSLMRSAAALHAATNQLFSIKGPSGMDINLGRDVSKDYSEAEQTTYKVYQDGTPTERVVAHRATEATSAAAKSQLDEEGNVTYSPGEVAYGGSVVAPVQALDASTVAQTSSGKSWDQLKRKSGGNPYLHSIYDAFKMDAMGYDTVLEEVNKNWLNTAMKWNYLKETYNSTLNAMTEFNKNLAKRSASEPLSTNERAYMDWMLAMVDGPYGKNMSNFRSKFPKFKDVGKTELNAVEAKMKKDMLAVGYDVLNPPANPTVAHLRQFTKSLSRELDLRSRLTNTIKKIENKKAELKKEIMKSAYRTDGGERIALQYYAH